MSVLHSPLEKEAIPCSSPLIKAINGKKLHEQDGRHTVFELQVLRLVTEELHSKPGAQTAADDGQQKERLFGRAPFLMDGFVFVDAIGRKGDDIDKG